MKDITPDVIHQFVRNVELFKDLTDSERELMAAAIEVREYPANSLLFEENSPRKRLYLVYTGEIELFKKTPFGEERRLAFFGRYDFLGEGALRDSSRYVILFIQY